MAGASSGGGGGGQHRVIAEIDERPGRAIGSGRASRFPPRAGCPGACHGDSREQSTRGARSSHPSGAGRDRSPVAADGGGVGGTKGGFFWVGRRTVTSEGLDDWLRPACYHSLTAPVLLCSENVRPKSPGVHASNVIRTYRASAGRDIPGGSCRSAYKTPPD